MHYIHLALALSVGATVGMVIGVLILLKDSGRKR